MSTNSIDLGGGGNSFPFDKPGDSVTGKVLSLESLQQTDMETGQPAVWDNGAPKMMYRVELQTDLRSDEFDDGRRSVYLRGSRKAESKSSMAAVLEAVRAAGAGSNLSVGGELTLAYVGDGEARKRGWNAPKQYSARYVPPAMNLTPGDAFAAEQPAQAAPAAQPVQPAAVPPPPGVDPATWAAFQAAQQAATS